MIPRVIHHCWFGGAPKPPLVERCIASWREHCPDFALREWNDETAPLPDVPYVRRCRERRAWAHLSDFAQAWALHEHGGVYLDSDVELRRPLDPLLGVRAFSGFESPGAPFTAVWGAEAGHPWPAAALDLLSGDAIDDLPRTNTLWMSDLLVRRYGVQRDVDDFQALADGVVLLPSGVLCLESPVSIAVHHFSGSWTDEAMPEPFGARLGARHRAATYLRVREPEVLRDLEALSAAARGEADDLPPVAGGLTRAAARTELRVLRLWLHDLRSRRRRPAR